MDYPNAGQAATTLNARFWNDAGGADSCSPTALGMCTLYNCPSAQAAGGPDAGAITVTSADAAFSQTLTFNTNGSYSTYGDSHPDFVGGEHVSVSTTGGTVPAFSDQLDYPLLLLLTNPVPADPSSVITIPVDQDLTLGWDRGTAGVSFALQSVTTADTYLTCEVPSELGSFTLPASTLAMLPSGTTFVLFTVASHSIVAGNYDVNVLVAGTVMWPDKMYRVMLQLGQ